MASTPTRAINLTRQLVAIRSTVPAARGRVHRGRLDCILPIQPTPASEIYRARIQYRHGIRPHVSIVEPRLVLHPGARRLPHVYTGDELCLYFPGEWQHSILLATTIVPWTAEWLLHYELWLATGEWTGGGIHATTSQPR